ncbi:hypothetical protein EGC76_11710 [Pseudidiomarina gelatinasegens]|uniref:Uncharacterized protein n=1 Tax=Pseudidiomarina gelatinasegens TaxID=2487740 RepID=A0A443YVJ4_9GAMM|nr:hypothetical protein [Pseudidiomarina gelatinasegens]RWU07984.1 hypothetical protein EGC76_11710 [Pseudidiomarina gelatinasegens]
MDIPSKHVFDALMDKGIDELHHANSVATACQFLRSRSLLSRGTVERLGITQTPQSSDDLDKRYGIWFDVFADSVDIHNRARRANAYGPVLFVFNTELINRSYTGRIWVTKLNPTKWSGKSEKQRWFQDKKDLEDNITKGTFDQMLVFRHCGGELPFKKFLKRIVLDDPQRTSEEDVDFYSMAVGALKLAMSYSNLDIPIERRVCRLGCKCNDNYGEDDERLYMMFDPKI